MVVLAVLWPACASWGRLRCSSRPRSWMLSLLSSRLVPRFVVAGLSDVAILVLQPGKCPTRCFGSLLSWLLVVGLSVVVRWPVWAWLVASGRCRWSPTPFVSHQACFVVARLFVACRRVRLLRCYQDYVWLVLPVGRRLRRLMVGLSCCWMCWATVAV